MAFQYQPPTGALSGVSFENQTMSFLDQLQDAIASNTQSLASQLQRIVSLENTVSELPDFDNVMTLNTAQTVAAIKKYTSTTEIESETYFRGRHTLYTKGGEKPETNVWQNYIVGQDASGTLTVSGRLSLIGQCIRTTGENSVVMSVSQPVAGSTLNNTLDMRYPPTGEPYTTINQPRSSPADNEIATVKYVKDYVAANAGGGSGDVTLAGNNTFTGTNLFNRCLEISNAGSTSTSTLTLLDSTVDYDTTSSIVSDNSVQFTDKDYNTLGKLALSYSNSASNKQYHLYLNLVDYRQDDYKERSIGLYRNANVTPNKLKAYVSQPNDDPDNDEIATVQYANVGTPGDTLQTCVTGISTGSNEVTYRCESMPATGWLRVGGRNVSDAPRIIRCVNATNGVNEIFALPAWYDEGTVFRVAKGHNIALQIASSITEATIQWLPDKGQSTIAPEFVRQA